MKRESKASIISDLVNVTTFDPLQVGVELTKDHRYLVEKEFETFLHFVGQLKRDADKNLFDERNKFACKCAKVIIDALEQADLYHSKYWVKYYDDVIKKYNEL